MSKKIKSVVSALLVIVMLVSTVGINVVYATDGTGIEDGKEAINETVDSKLKYVYVESPYLEIAENTATQNIVVSFHEGNENLENVSIVVKKADGSISEWTCTNSGEQLYLFSKELSASDAGTYQVTSVKYSQNGVEEELSLLDMNAAVEFGVNKEYEGYGENIVDLEYASEELETTIVTIDENGEMEAQDSITDALEEVTGAPAGSAVKGRASNIVVALDPGHDSIHAGAQKNGLKEEVLTLKIANYAKAELETYEGVSVYMTRSTASCPYPNSGNSGQCIKQRAYAAAAAGARIYVSMHLNSQADGTAANGAEIIYPNSSWKAQVGADGKALAQSIQNELVKLGLTNRGIYSKDTTINERYEDGSISDYYAVQIYNKENGVPGVIVEHAFLSNTSDVNKYLKTESGLKSLGVADATGIANFLGLSKKGSNTSGGSSSSSGTSSDSTTSTQTVSIPSGVYSITMSTNSGYALDIYGASTNSGANLQLYAANGTKAQQFYIQSYGSYYTIRNLNSNKMLDVAGAGMSNGTNVWQYESNATNAQKWKIVQNSDDSYSFISVLNGLALDVCNGTIASGSNIQVYTSNGTNAQKFALNNLGENISGSYYIQSKANINYVLDISGASTSSGANLQIYASNGTGAQKFYIESQNGYCTIKNINSNMMLDVYAAGMSAGTNVWQYTSNGTDAQKWQFIKNSDGSYTIISALNGLALDVYGGTISSGTNVQVYTPNGTNAQKFVLKQI